MPEPSRLRQALVILAHAVVGWAWCGALVGIGRQLFSLETTLVLHAVGAPIGFALLTLLYQRRFGFTGPLATAASFLGVVVFLDLALVAPVFEKSFAMFSSLLGTWIPFALIFAATWLTSRWTRAARRAA